MSSNGFRLWSGRIQDDEEWEHAKIRQWCKAIHNLAHNGERGGHASSVTEDEANELLNLFDEKYPGEYDGPRVTEQQAEFGRHWLATTGRRLGLDINHDPADIAHFTFPGGKTLHGGYRMYVTPVYVAHWADGMILRYWATPWQDTSDFEYLFTHRQYAG